MRMRQGKVFNAQSIRTRRAPTVARLSAARRQAQVRANDLARDFATDPMTANCLLDAAVALLVEKRGPLATVSKLGASCKGLVPDDELHRLVLAAVPEGPVE